VLVPSFNLDLHRKRSTRRFPCTGNRANPIAARGAREEEIEKTEQIYLDLGTRDATSGYKLISKIANLDSH